MKQAEKTKKRYTKNDTNLLAVVGKPFFSLLLAIVACFGFIVLLSVGLWKRMKSFPQMIVASLDNLVTSLLSKQYLKKTTQKKVKTQKKPVFKFSFRRPSTKVTIFALLLLCWFYYFYVQIFVGLPSPYKLTQRTQKLTTQILDQNGQLLFKIYQDENRTPISLQSLPPYVKEAFLAIEDNGFYKHTGFSATSLIRATLHNINLKCKVANVKCSIEGGSTITQQLVKNALLNNEKTWQRKIRELILAIAVESVYSKDQILEMYLNEVGFGGPAYGIQEASRQYFNVDAANLTLPQAALLAGLPKAPSKYSPFINPEASNSRKNLVLSSMLKAGYINKESYDQSTNTKLSFVPFKIEINAPHFVMYVRDLLVDQYGEEMVSHGGLKVTTSLDLDLQKKAEAVLNTELTGLSRMNVSNGSILITKPNSGNILAMVGSKNYFDLEKDGQVNLTTALRQPGSSIKVVNYALAFEKGNNPNTFIKDEPITFNLPGTTPWTPKNYDGRFHGTVTLRQALANSYNIPAVLLLAKNGIANMVALGQKLGISTWNDPSRYGLSLTLGGAEVKMTDLAVVYGTLANNGVVVPLNPILQIEDSTGKKLTFDPCFERPNCPKGQVLKPETAFYLSDILSDNQARSAAFGFRSVLNLGKYKAAVKTGTSNDLRDNWTVGYTPDFVVATWVGNNDNSPMNRVASGITGASPIWAKVMTDLISKNPNNTPFGVPKNIVRLPICVYTGNLTCSGCPTRYEYFAKGSEPKTACNPQEIQKLIEEKAKLSPTPASTSQILNGASTTRTN